MYLSKYINYIDDACYLFSSASLLQASSRSPFETAQTNANLGLWNTSIYNFPFFFF